MASHREAETDLIPVQHFLVRRTAILESGLQLVILGGAVALFYVFDLSFEVSLFLFLVLALTLHAMNAIAIAITHNIHLAEIRDLLLQERHGAAERRRE